MNSSISACFAMLLWFFGFIALFAGALLASEAAKDRDWFCLFPAAVVFAAGAVAAYGGWSLWP